ncbi:MAG: hypothetical protein PT944_04260 [Actinomycetaceae bacterium]|nr:hypothetical protein [Arcanobacterium sp.]MDD7687118.1 hypothetical protein [Actinomycetaceae bacterium]MDY5273217.1 hypothetical protein [Arcanobacterium sp.]
MSIVSCSFVRYGMPTCPYVLLVYADYAMACPIRRDGGEQLPEVQEHHQAVPDG